MHRLSKCLLRPTARLLLLAIVAGCSGQSTIATTPLAPADSVELYLSRASMTGGEFETYKLLGNELFVECGRYQRGRHLPTFDSILSVDESVTAQLMPILSDLSDAVQRGSGFAEPGESSNLFDPGEARLIVSSGADQFEVRTSLDALASPVTLGERHFSKVALSLRAAPKRVLCGNLTFFGLGRPAEQ